MENDQLQLLDSSYSISLRKAARLVYQFLCEPELYKIARNEAIGGITDPSILTPVNFLPYKGTMAWFCRNLDEVAGYPKCFLAFEDGEYRISDVPKKPKSLSLTFSESTFTFDLENFSEDDVLKMLEGGLEDPKIKMREIPKEQVTEFRTNFGRCPRNKRYNKYYCSFFENRGVLNRDIEAMLADKKVEYLKYFFGYDASHNKYFESNRIRVILLGYSKSEKLISISQLDGKTGRILQDSWPPPPPNN
jgi:hypothetical protein